MYCIVCKDETRKYKCPSCSEYYCSLGCFKTHKESDCNNLRKTNSEEKQNVDAKESFTHLPFKTEDTVHTSLLKKLENDALKKLLENPHLRNYLQEIDGAPSAWKAMKVAMQEPLFIEFADECLKIVEPSEKEFCDNEQ